MLRKRGVDALAVAINLDARKKKILKVVVHQHVLTGKPVSSNTVAEVCNIEVSPATIRNEMAILEDMGLLSQPHTSAGRVPTDFAYRYYVDMLMSHPRPTRRDREAVRSLFEAKKSEIEGIYGDVSILLSRLTNTTAMVFAPMYAGDTLKHIETISVSPRRVIIVFITGKGMTFRRLIELEKGVEKMDLENALVFIQSEVTGKRIGDIDIEKIIAKMNFNEAAKEFIRLVLEEVKYCLGIVEEHVYVGGTANIIREFENESIEWIQILLDAIEKKYVLLGLLKDLIGKRQLTVRIGEENQVCEFKKCSFVGKSYPIGEGGLFGSMGVLGPTSMNYTRTIGTVEYMAESLGELLSDSFA
ncbi:MAG: heat-inducible transcriptional repressor HrcA [Actinomycetota bacterium]|nr:heat-inducible transcriptional repressor HrcA [Actinomycetota bacterium]